VIRAPHPGEDHEPSAFDRGEARERQTLVGETGGGTAEGIRLSRDLRDEWVRKLS
jgi:hypothetical protein